MDKTYQKSIFSPKNFLKSKRSGFTLIELLVVVLIIGILAAVALPQYLLAVQKSKALSLLPLGRSIIEAERLYLMSNGDYCYDFNELDVSLPSDMACLSNAYADGDCPTKKNNTASYNLASKNGRPRLYIVGENENIVFVWFFDSSSPRCYSNLDPARERLCKALGGVRLEDTPRYYILPF